MQRCVFTVYERLLICEKRRVKKRVMRWPLWINTGVGKRAGIERRARIKNVEIEKKR